MDDETLARWIAGNLGGNAGSPLSPDDLVALLDAIVTISADAGTVLFNRDDPGGTVFVLHSGRVALSRPGAGRSRLLHLLSPGEVFGDVAVLLDRLEPVDAVALDDVVVLTIDGADLLRLLTTRPAVAMRWLVSLAARVASSQDRVEELLAGSLDLQLATLLRRTADADGKVRASQSTLAQLLGAGRPSIARSLATLERRGLVEKGYREIRITDPEGLAAIGS